MQIHTVKPFYKIIMVEGQKMQMELDIGAAVSLISYKKYREKLSHPPLKKAETQLRMYTGEVITPKGQVAVKVEENNHTHTLPLLVVDGSVPPLLGCNWLAKLEVPWNGEQINALCAQAQETEKWLNERRSWHLEGNEGKSEFEGRSSSGVLSKPPIPLQ